jgi:3-oxoacyl-[acyl-carrier protein] reductase
MTGGPLAGRVALVTGAGKGRGIGTAVCRALAARGADIAFTHRGQRDEDSEGGPSSLELELHAAGVRALAVPADLREPAAAAQLLELVASRLGTPSILVNNAAHSVPSGFATLDAHALDDHYAVNVRAPVLLACDVARRHPAGAPGRIVNLVSGQSLGPMPGELPYATTKGALETFTRQLAAEVAALGITVNAVNPGPTDTGWMDEPTRRALRERFPTGRLGKAQDAARLVAWLCSDDAGWVTGQVIASEGGFLRG